MSNPPKIKAVTALSNYRLLVTFQDSRKKIYDCTPLLTEQTFINLKNTAFFKLVTVDAGGYGASWNEDVDLSESELWQNGIPVNKSNALELV